MIIRIMPIVRRLKGGPTLLTLGKYGPSAPFRESTTLGNVEICWIETKNMDPMIGPGTVPKPPITDIIRGKNEFAGEKIELSMSLMK